MKIPLRFLVVAVAICSAVGVALFSGKADSSTVIQADQAPSVDFSIDMPIELADAEMSAFGLIPFGVHIADHGIDGHPGWDVEYKIGAPVRAAAAGTVQSVISDPQQPDKKTLQILHQVGNRGYRSVYNNMSTVLPEIVPGAKVSAGQPVGNPAVQTQNTGVRTVTFAMIHFQLDDFSRNVGLTNTSAVSPEAYLSANGRAVFNAIWEKATFTQELCEPYPTNSRTVSFPLTRVWTLQAGVGANRIDIQRSDAKAVDFEYSLFDANNMLTESGTAKFQPDIRTVSILDFTPTGGGKPRLGICDILGKTMRLALGEPGGPRPETLAAAAVYRTSKKRFVVPRRLEDKARRV